MDEKLLTGRFTVEPDITYVRKSESSASNSRRNSATPRRPATCTGENPSSSTSRPKSVSRPNSRAGAVLRRSKSAFEVELFKSKLRLNKQLSWKRFRPEHLEFASRAENDTPSPSLDGFLQSDDSADEEISRVQGQRSHSGRSTRSKFSAKSKSSGFTRKSTSGQIPSELDEFDGNDDEDFVIDDESDVYHSGRSRQQSREQSARKKSERTSRSSSGKKGSFTADTGDDSEPESDVKVQDPELTQDEDKGDESHGDVVDGREQKDVDLTSDGAGAKRQPRPTTDRRPTSDQKPIPDWEARASPIRRKKPEISLEWLRFFQTKDSELQAKSPRQLSPIKAREGGKQRSGSGLSMNGVGHTVTWRDGSIVQYPQRVKQSDKLTLRLRSLNGSTSNLAQRRGSDSSDDELAALREPSPNDVMPTLTYETSDVTVNQKDRKETESESGDQYDTDCEPDETSDFKRRERYDTMSRLNADIGHKTYQHACATLGLVPSQRIIKGLATSCLCVTHAGFTSMDAKAIALALLHNTRLEEVNLSHNGFTGPGVTYIADSLQQNSFVTKLNLSGNQVQSDGAMALAELIKMTNCITHLNLSECQIGDDETEYLAKGIQENASIICLNLSKNKIETKGGRLLGAALGLNTSIECLNLSWNMLRGGGAVAVCNSLQRNSSIRELNLSWNGLGFHGSLALSEALKTNRTLQKVDISNNRVDWDCVPYIARALTLNRTLEVLEMGHNPVSMDGVLKLLDAIDKPISHIRFLSLTDIPINTKIAFKATEISKKKEFSMEHGGVITTRDVFGIKRVKREDPLTLLIRYLTTMGIRVVDLFRMFDTSSKLYVSQANFIRGLKRVRVPLDEDDMLRVARRMRSDKRGDISYQELAANVRSRIREDIKEDHRQRLIEFKKRESRRRILQSDLPLHAPSSFAYLPALYNMYGSRIGGRGESTTPSVSRKGSVAYLHRTPTAGFLPPIDSPEQHRSPGGRKSTASLRDMYKRIGVDYGDTYRLYGQDRSPSRRNVNTPAAKRLTEVNSESPTQRNALTPGARNETRKSADKSKSLANRRKSFAYGEFMRRKSLSQHPTSASIQTKPQRSEIPESGQKTSPRKVQASDFVQKTSPARLQASNFGHNTPPSLAAISASGKRTPQTLINSGLKGLPGVGQSRLTESANENNSTRPSRLAQQNGNGWDHNQPRRM